MDGPHKPEDTAGRPRRLLAALLFLVLYGATACGFYFLGLNRGFEQGQNGAFSVVPAPPLPKSAEPGRLPEAVPPPSGGGILGPNSVADIAQAVSPSVVNIDVFSQLDYSGARFPDLEFFFNGSRVSPFRENPDRPRFMKNGTGSGLIIRADGYVLTNNHVVRGMDRIKVTLSDRRSFIGKVVGRDAVTDLAVVKIPAANLTPIRVGSIKLVRPGDWAIAIGSPLGLDQSVTLGIISAINRSVSDVNSDVGFIQTDAAINPGNSGGPLVNLQGEVIGINTFIRSDAQNIGFATPIDVARTVSDELIVNKRIERTWVGIKMASLTSQGRAHLQLPKDTTGVLVVSVVENSPAEHAGLEVGDVIQYIDGTDIASVKDVQKLVRQRKPGDSVNFTVLRDLQVKSLEIALAEMPGDAE